VTTAHVREWLDQGPSLSQNESDARRREGTIFLGSEAEFTTVEVCRLDVAESVLSR